MEHRDEAHLYPILPEQGYFDAGMTGDGRQVLMGLYCPDLVAIFFNRSGDLLVTERRHLEFLQRRGGFYDIYDEWVRPRLKAWQNEMGYRPATIRVKKFVIAGLGIGIEDYPAHFAEILEDPDCSEDEKAGVRESMHLWDADKQFVLLWGNDFWLEGTGEVVSS